MTNSYPIRNKAAPLNHQVYKKLLYWFNLDASDRVDLVKRGLSHDQIQAAGYGSKHVHKSATITNAIGKCAQEFDLNGVPGFFIDDKTCGWDCAHIDGLYIPIRDIDSNIHSILIRNDRVQEKNGKKNNKYMAFSSAGKKNGVKVWQITHCPSLKGKAKEVCGSEVRITEGVLKADVATVLGDVYTLGLQGLKVHDDLSQIFEELQISTVRIALDQGEDGNNDMMRCKAELINLIRKCGHDVVVEAWDAKYGKGIDDVLKAGHKDKIRRWTEAEVEALLDKAGKKNPMNGEWVYVIEERGFVNIKRGTTYDKGQFADLFGLVDLKNVNMLLANNYPQVIRKTFIPQAEKIVNEGGEDCYNTWRDPGIQPVEGDVKPLTDHLEYLFPIKEEREMLLDYLAYQIQYPGLKINYALLVQGREGIGKSFIGEMMTLLLGDSNVCHPSNEQLHEKFSRYQKYTQLIIVEEMMSRGRLDMMNKLKPMITQGTTTVREMHRNAYEITNRYNIMAFTNYPDAIIIDEQDRRWLILRTSNTLRSKEAYIELWAWLQNEKSLQALTYFFMNCDLSGFNPKGRAPETEAKRDLIECGRSQLEEWVADGIESGESPFNIGIVSIHHLKSYASCPQDLKKKSSLKWADALKKAGAIPYKDRTQVKLSGGTRHILWIFGVQKDFFNELPPAEIAVRYEKGIGGVGTANPLDENAPL